MIEIALFLSGVANLVLIVLLHLQQRDTTAMAERLANRAFASDRVWNPNKELDTEPHEPYREPSETEEFLEEQERHKQIVQRYKDREGQIPLG